MQVRSVGPALARRPVVATSARPAVQPAPAPAPKAAAPVKPKTDSGFGSDIFQSFLLGLTNLGAIVKLPGGLSQLIQMVPPQALGVMNLVMGGMGMFKDIKGLKDERNTKNTDNYIRIGGNAALLAGGAALLAGAAVAPVLPLIGAGVAVAGFAAKIVGTWQDETRW